MEANLELVEKLVEKTGISYTEAKAVLVKTDWDILEALIELEAEGKINKSNTAEYSTRNGSGDCGGEYIHKERREKKSSAAGENFKATGKSFGEMIRDIVDKGNSNYIEMYRNNERKLGMPVTAFALLLVIGFWIVIPLMIVAVFLGCRFSFSGKELGKDSVNNAMGKANEFADNIKSEIKNELNKDRERSE